MKKNDIIKFKFNEAGETHQGKVNWVNEGNVGITLIGEDFKGQEATVMHVEDCELVVEYKGDELINEIHSMPTEELKEAIQRLKGMRFPKKMVARASRNAPRSESKKQKMTKLLEAMDNDPSLLDSLIAKALKEDE